MPTSVAGFFGKLPCAGDFVQRRLPSAFVEGGDRHFEEAVAASRAELGGELTRIAVSRVGAVGSMQAWRPALPVTQWSWTKP